MHWRNILQRGQLPDEAIVHIVSYPGAQGKIGNPFPQEQVAFGRILRFLRMAEDFIEVRTVHGHLHPQHILFVIERHAVAIRPVANPRPVLSCFLAKL